MSLIFMCTYVFCPATPNLKPARVSERNGTRKNCLDSFILNTLYFIVYPNHIYVFQ